MDYFIDNILDVSNLFNVIGNFKDFVKNPVKPFSTGQIFIGKGTTENEFIKELE